MTNTKDDGGPAFPSDMLIGHAVKASKPFSGMSLRDWFAGQAIAGMMSKEPWFSAENCAKAAYHVADAMLEARK